MKADSPERIAITIGAGQSVSGLAQPALGARACYVFAHGAGAGMEHPFMAAVVSELVARRIASLRYQFPYIERGSRRPDPPKVAHAAVRAAVAEAARRFPGLALFAGGKSFGGRMTSQAQALSPLPGVAGLAFVGFPLHPAGKPSAERGEHLRQVDVPILFIQGTRDELADLALVRALATQLGARSTLRLIDDADHSFHVRKSSGRSDAQVVSEIADALANWIEAKASG